MSSLIIFDPNQTPNPVISYIGSNIVPSDYQGRSDVLLDADISAVAGLPIRYWKHVAGAIQAMTVPERNNVDAAIAAAVITLMRSTGISGLSSQDGPGVLQRAFADIVKDEINILRQWLASFKAEVAASTNLANFQSRVATLPNTPDRSLSQLRTAIENRINGGTVDQ